MALSPYRNKTTAYRNRSSSFSAPKSRNFLFQEVFTTGENALIRSFSCTQFFTQGKNGETFESTQVQMSNFISPIKNFKVNKMKEAEYRKGLERPQARLAIQFKESGEKSLKISRLINILYFAVLIFTILCSCYIYRHRYCNMEWKLEGLSEKLTANVFGQDAATMQIRNLLDKFSYSKDSMIISFIGGIGVGKTLVANIIYDNFPWEVNKHLHFFGSHTKEIIFEKTYSSCGANLIIIDGLNKTSVNKALALGEMTLSFNLKSLLILLFQSRNSNETEIIFRSLNGSNHKVHSVIFNNLNHNDVRKCFEAELNRQGRVLSEMEVNKLVDENMKYCNISQGHIGCKNVFHEVSLLTVNV